MKNSFTIFFILTLVLNLNTRPISAQDKSEDGKIQTRVYVKRQCLLSEDEDKGSKEFIEVIGAVLLPVLIEHAVGAAAGALKKAGADDIEKGFGTRSTYFYGAKNKDLTELETFNLAKEKRDEINTLKEQITEIDIKVKHEKEPQKIELFENEKRRLLESISKIEKRPIPTTKKQIGFNTNLGCLIVIRGEFDGKETNGDMTLVNIPKEKISATDISEIEEKKRINRLNASNIPVTKISMVYEATIVQSEDNTAFLYESRYLQMNEFIDYKSTKPRNLVLTISLFSPDGGTEKALSTAVLDFGKISPKKIYGNAEIASQVSNWLPMVSVDKKHIEAVAASSILGKGEVGVVPITFVVTIAETKKGNAALKFIGEVLDSSKKELGKNISAKVFEDGDAKELKEMSEVDKLKDEEAKAYNTFLDAQKAVDGIDASIRSIESDIEIANKNLLTAELELAVLRKEGDQVKISKKEGEILTLQQLVRTKEEALRVAKANRSAQVNLENAKSVWCSKFKALEVIGVTPSARRIETCLN